MKEIWKDIEGYEGRYKVSNKGRVYDNKLDKFIGYESLGYMCVALCKDKKQKKCRVHRLVAQAFIPNPDNLPVINHKDENKTNNCVENLEWCTVKYNTNYGTSIQRQKETKKIATLICLEFNNNTERWRNPPQKECIDMVEMLNRQDVSCFQFLKK